MDWVEPSGEGILRLAWLCPHGRVPLVAMSLIELGKVAAGQSQRDQGGCHCRQVWPIRTNTGFAGCRARIQGMLYSSMRNTL